MMNVDNANRGADKTAAPEARQGPFPHRPKREWLTRGPWDLNHRSGRHEFICAKALVDQLHGHKNFSELMICCFICVTGLPY